MHNNVQDAPLGKTSDYITQYDPTLLFPIPRQLKRDEINVTGALPFLGEDIWTAYELSWLNNKGKPVVSLAEFRFPCTTPNLVESKSFKLYLNSFNQTRFDSEAHVLETLKRDLSNASGGEVFVKLISINDTVEATPLAGTLIDDQDIEIDTYELTPGFLSVGTEITNETLSSNLLKSNCLVTGQPDWASVTIDYKGPKIDRAGLLKYIISFREHNEFHEQCVERLFVDITKYCKPTELSVYARYTRRGGLDINPFRSSKEEAKENLRTIRQ